MAREKACSGGSYAPAGARDDDAFVFQHLLIPSKLWVGRVE
jgi:hypothetical protein